MTVQLLPFQFGCLFCSSCLIAVARTPTTKLNKRGESIHPHLVPDLKGNIFFLTEYDVDCVFVIYGLYYVELCSLYSHFAESFYCECWFLSNAFSASMDMIMWFLSFILFMWYITFIVDIVATLQPWSKSIWS